MTLLRKQDCMCVLMLDVMEWNSSGFLHNLQTTLVLSIVSPLTLQKPKKWHTALLRCFGVSKILSDSESSDSFSTIFQINAPARRTALHWITTRISYVIMCRTLLDTKYLNARFLLSNVPFFYSTNIQNSYYRVLKVTLKWCQINTAGCL